MKIRIVYIIDQNSLKGNSLDWSSIHVLLANSFKKRISSTWSKNTSVSKLCESVADSMEYGERWYIRYKGDRKYGAYTKDNDSVFEFKYSSEGIFMTSTDDWRRKSVGLYTNVN